MDFKKAARKFFRRIDWFLLAMCTALVILSVVLLVGIARAEYVRLLRFHGRTITSQWAAALAGIVAALIIANVNYRSLTEKWKLYVPAAYLLTLSTFVLGVSTADRADAVRWLVIPVINMSIQPSEFLRLAFILSFAYHVYKTGENFNHPLNILLLCIHGLAPAALAQLQGDSGTALIFGAIFLVMMFIAGIRFLYIAVACILIPAAVPLVWTFLLSPMQRQRIWAVLGQSEADALGYYFQQNEAAKAIGAGGLTGVGVFSENLSYVPEINNDFMFAFIGNSLGLIGCMAIMLIIALISSKILLICHRAGDVQGRLICAGVFAMIFVQSAVNILMCLSLFPVIGNSLPFLSSGGSSVLSNYMGIGLVLSVYKYTDGRKRLG